MQKSRRISGRLIPALVLAVLTLITLWLLRPQRVWLPVLMYHHVDEVVDSDMTVSPASFEEQIAALTEAGWNSVSTQQLIDFVDKGTPLPKKPILITFDDGYTSNLDTAAPILEKHGQRGVVFVIGINAGEELYPHSGEPFTLPRFALAEAQPAIDSGVLELQSHTYDMHQRASYGYSGREGVLPLPDETEEAYTAALTQDALTQKTLFKAELGLDITALSYPFGFCSELSDSVLASQGVRITCCSDPGISRVEAGAPESLYQLKRYVITDDMDAADLLWLIKQH